MVKSTSRAEAYKKERKKKKDETGIRVDRYGEYGGVGG